MKLREIPKDELELMSYDDIALIILQESGKKMKLEDIFKKIGEVLELSESAYEDQLMEFFENMSINKKFVMLDNGYWDLQSRHKMHMVVEDMEEDEEIIDDSPEDIESSETDDNSEEDIFYDKDDENDDVDDDDLADLMIVDDNDEANLE